MSVFGNLGLSAAERLERSVGPAVAIHSYKILMSDPDRSVVATATFCALRCAVASRDEQQTAQLISLWAERRAGRPGGAIKQLVARLLAEGRGALAHALCEAEVQRCPTARSAYLAARICEQVGDLDAAIMHYRAAAGRATEEGEQPVAAASLARCLEIAVERGSRQADGSQEELIALAQQIPLSHAAPAQALLAARILLRQAGKYRRASTLSTLRELASGEPAEVARAAVVLACQHADAMGSSLSWVEAERVAACLAHWPLQAQRQDALQRLRALQDAAKEGASGKAPAAGEEAMAAMPAAKTVPGRLRAFAERAPEVRRYLDRAAALLDAAPLPTVTPAPVTPQVACAQHALDALAAIRRDQPDDALAALQKAWQQRQGAPPPALWSALLAGLMAGGRLRTLCVDLVSQLIRNAAGSPPRGFLPYALALCRVEGAETLALSALRAAGAAGESGAREQLAAELARRGWHSAQRGERLAAIRLLREAKTVAVR